MSQVSLHFLYSSTHILQMRNKLQPAFSRQNQSTAHILQTEPKYSPHSPNRTKVQLTFSRQEPRYSPHSSDRTKAQPAFSRQNQSTARILQTEPKYSLHSPDRIQGTAHILQTGTEVQFIFQRAAKVRCASARQKPSHRLCTYVHAAL